MKGHNSFGYLWKFESNTPNSFGEILSQNLKSLLKVHVLISVFATLANSQVLIAAISSVIDCKELKIAQTAQNKQLFKLLKLICTYDDVFYGITRMLMRNNVWNSVVSRDSPMGKK